MTAVATLPAEKDDHNEKTFSFQTQGQETEGREKVTMKSPGLMQSEKFAIKSP